MVSALSMIIPLRFPFKRQRLDKPHAKNIVGDRLLEVSPWPVLLDVVESNSLVGDSSGLL